MNQRLNLIALKVLAPVLPAPLARSLAIRLGRRIFHSAMKDLITAMAAQGEATAGVFKDTQRWLRVLEAAHTMGATNDRNMTELCIQIIRPDVLEDRVDKLLQPEGA